MLVAQVLADVLLEEGAAGAVGVPRVQHLPAQRRKVIPEGESEGGGAAESEGRARVGRGQQAKLQQQEAVQCGDRGHSCRQAGAMEKARWALMWACVCGDVGAKWGEERGRCHMLGKTQRVMAPTGLPKAMESAVARAALDRAQPRGGGAQSKAQGVSL